MLLLYDDAQEVAFLERLFGELAIVDDTVFRIPELQTCVWNGYKYSTTIEQLP
jgi:hypothetical protein